MPAQLTLFDSDPEDANTGLITLRHLNLNISGKLGAQDAESVPGLHFVEGFLTPDEQALCVQRIDAA